MHDWEGSSAYVEQGRHWSSALMVALILFGGTLIWAFTARIDQTVTVVAVLAFKQFVMLNLLVLELLVRSLSRTDRLSNKVTSI